MTILLCFSMIHVEVVKLLFYGSQNFWELRNLRYVQNVRLYVVRFVIFLIFILCQTSTVNGRCLVDDKLQPNIEGLIEDFEIIGKGLVESVENLQK